MDFRRASAENCHLATGAVVVIDVLRAFSTAAYAFAAGAEEILLVSTVEQALALQARFPGSLTMGEVQGLPIEGFDFGNSPGAFVGIDLTGRRLIQRTSSGTPGIVRSLRADVLLACSLCCAGATARYLRRLAPERVTSVITGARPGGWGDEDAACADYVEALLRGQRPDPAPYLQRVRESRAARAFIDPSRPEFPAEDLLFSMRIDLFDFAMPVTRRQGLFHMKAVHP